MKTNPKTIEPATITHQTAYESPRLTRIGNARDVVLGVSDLSGDDYFGYSRFEFEFAPDGDDAETR